MSSGTHLFSIIGVVIVQSLLLNLVAESLVPHLTPYSTAEGDVWALDCILAEMIANVRSRQFASPEDRDYIMVDRTTLYETLPILDAAYTFLT